MYGGGQVGHNKSLPRPPPPTGGKSIPAHNVNCCNINNIKALNDSVCEVQGSD